MKKLVLLTILLLGIMTAFCQAVDTVTLKDGTVVTGTIRQYEPGKYVVIDVEGGSQKMYNWDVISSVDKQTSTVAPAPTEPEPKPGRIKINTRDKIKLQYDATLPSDKLREYWQKQGGSRFYSDMNASYVSLKMSMKMDTTDGFGNVGKKVTKMESKGFGLNGSLNWLYFSPPDYATKKYYSFATKLGFSYGLTGNSLKMDPIIINVPPYYMKSSTDLAIMNVDLGAALGINVGLGAFPLSQKWYGAIMGLTWRPAFKITGTTTNTTTVSNLPGSPSGLHTDNNTDTQFDTGAIEYSIDFGSIKAMSDRFAPHATLKVNFIYVPPVGENKMSLMMFGIGIGQYK